MFADLKSKIREIDGTITAQVQVPVDSDWFDGHFPDKAILPGVAQLAIIEQILCGARDQTVCVAGVRRVRFKQAIGPDERITVEITPMEKNTLTCGFRLLKGAELACSGVVEFSVI